MVNFLIASFLICWLTIKSFGSSANLFNTSSINIFQIHQQLGWIAVFVLLIGYQLELFYKREERLLTSIDEKIKLIYESQKSKDIIETTDIENITAENKKENNYYLNYVIKGIIAIILLCVMLFFICHSTNKKEINNNHIPAAEIYK